MFNYCAVTFALALIIIIQIVLATDNSPCADWEPYKDEKCYKILSTVGLIPFEEAESACKKNSADSRLISIKYPEEQAFLANFLFNKSKIVDPIWIDARFKAGKLVSDHDGKDQTYTNWAPSRPKSATDNCVVLDFDSDGKWLDDPCSKSARVVCEAPQRWTLDKMQQTLEETVKRLEATQNQLTNAENRLNEAQNQGINTQKQLDNLQKNPVPIGFIYSQLAGQPEPTALWPTVQWSEVSSNYSGLFFRVIGGNSAQFGVVQEENAPRLVGAKLIRVGDQWDGEVSFPANGEYVGRLWSGSNYVTNAAEQFHGHQFKISSGEVRPRNQGMRLWRRIA